MNITIVSLGCPKNQVDCDIITHSLLKDGNITVADMNEADVCIINTCGFITSAKEEAIENIFNAVEVKKTNPNLKIVVTGCLAQRYKDEILNMIPEVNAVFGIGENANLPKHLKRVNTGEVFSCYSEKTNLDISAKRIISTPKHYAYLKIAEGCSNNCHYCAIPLIRGPQRSRDYDSCVQEAKWLASEGVKEIILVAQDITAYGEDLYNKRRLAELIKEISEIEDIKWIRLMYTYPERLDDEVIFQMRDNEKVLPYIDMPVQHINDEVLKSMNRKGGTDIIKDAIKRLRENVKDVAIRTSLITGYPTETQKEFDELHEFVKEYKIERLGCFAFSPEEGTVAEKLENKNTEEVRQQRADTIMKLQTEIMAQKQADMVGKTIDVICDEYDEDNELFICRSVYDAPEIDGEVYLDKDSDIKVGDIKTVKVLKSDLYDLYAQLI